MFSSKGEAPQLSSNLTTSVSNSVAAEGASSSLTIRNSTAELSKIKCVISNTAASPSSIDTNEVNFDVGAARRLIAFERYGEGSTSVVQTDQRDVGQTGALTFRANASINARMIVVQAPEQDVDVKITLGGAAGAARNGNRGGSGGISVFKTTLKKGDEYLIKLGVNYEQGGGPRGGINGGGGIGATLNTAFSRYEFDTAAAILLIIILIVMVLEYTSSFMRKWVQ